MSHERVISHAVGTSITALSCTQAWGGLGRHLLGAARRNRGTQESGNCECYCARDLTRTENQPRYIHLSSGTDTPSSTGCHPGAGLGGSVGVVPDSRQRPG